MTHHIDEAIELGSSALVLGKPAHLLMDMAISQEANRIPSAVES